MLESVVRDEEDERGGWGAQLRLLRKEKGKGDSVRRAGGVEAAADRGGVVRKDREGEGVRIGRAHV